MTSSDLFNNAWAIFLIVGFVLMFLGYRRARVKTGSRVAIAPERLSMPLIWAGVAVLVAGSVYGLVLAILQGSVFGMISSLVSMAVWAYVVVTIARTQRRLRTAE